MLLAGAAIGLAAAAAPDEAAQRARLERERAAAETRYQQALQACSGSFALTNCQERARAERRKTFDRLDAEEADLDAAQRRRRAEERQREIERNAAQRPAASAAATEPRPHAPPAPTPVFPKVAPPAPQSASAAAKREAETLERYRQRQERAAAHKAEVERRNAEQDAKRPPAPGLPPAPPASR